MPQDFHETLLQLSYHRTCEYFYKKILLPENGKEECFFKIDFDELCVLNLACIRMKERKSSLLQLISHEQAFGCSPNSH